MLALWNPLRPQTFEQPELYQVDYFCNGEPFNVDLASEHCGCVTAGTELCEKVYTPFVFLLSPTEPPVPVDLDAAVQAAAAAIQAAMSENVGIDAIRFNTETINTGIYVPATVQEGDVNVAMGAIASARGEKSAESATSVTMVAFTEVANNLAKQVLVVASDTGTPREVLSETAAELTTFSKNVVDDFVSELAEKSALQITMEAANNFINGEFQVPQVALDSRGNDEDAMASALADYFIAPSLSDARAALGTVAATIQTTEGYAAEQGEFWRVWLETLELQAQFKATLNAIGAERTRAVVLHLLKR